MAYVRRLLGPTLQEAFDLDREEGPRWLAGENVYLFTDPIQQGYAISEVQLVHRQNVVDQNVWFAKTAEGEKGILRACALRLKNVSGGSFTVDVRVILHIPEEGTSGGFTDIQLWEETGVSLANNGSRWFRLASDLPFLQDFRIPENAELRITAWGTSGSNQDWTLRALWDKIPATVHLAK